MNAATDAFVLDGQTELIDLMTAAIASGPRQLSPLSLVLRAYGAAIPLFVAGRAIAERRARIIATSPSLQERAHAKSAALAQALIGALEARGIPEPTARLAARAGAAILNARAVPGAVPRRRTSRRSSGRRTTKYAP